MGNELPLDTRIAVAILVKYGVPTFRAFLTYLLTLMDLGM
jgi:hypothetical protein